MNDNGKCGSMKGKIFEGETCPECNTKIEFRDVDLKYTGLIIALALLIAGKSYKDNQQLSI